MSTATTPQPLLQISDVRITFDSAAGPVHAVKGANLTVYPGQAVAIVGESGSGKSTTAMSAMGLLSPNARITEGTVRFDGVDVTRYTEKQWQRLRGREIGLVPQDPMSNLNPVWRVGRQIEEIPGNHDVVALLEEAGLTDAARRARQFPHEYSGGMRQRALIAMGLASRPRLLIADEPTSALDVTVQKLILDHLEKLTAELGTAVLFITHDLGLAAERAEHLVVMSGGRVVESGPSREILTNPQHSYTRRLVEAAPAVGTPGTPRQRSNHERVISVENLTKDFGKNRAVDDVSFYVRTGTTTAVVGESGSGKSTVANMILGLLQPTSGVVRYKGKNLDELSRQEKFEMRRRMQVVFQNPYGSLDPMYSIQRCIEEPMKIHGIGRKQRASRVGELLDMVAMPRSVARRYPNELSGGQRQRIAIARALALDPEVIVLDEAVSALDVVVQDQVLRLLGNLQEELGLSYLFITHDLAVVRHTADDVVVMRGGRIVERGDTERVFRCPEQEYTRNLIDAVPGWG
ncbi:ABC transporter ATP-binding protein [Corynebacterium sp. zg-331]|uniref:dipeptide ABC transporter ATP-binding protein n=1 Tax=unclassified Corynebacterium TaxID=2624378 RepID=UPI00128C78A8|nr:MULTISPECIES: ABC transporter ATP-binding protein [unclassified Corynebacterium]MBC3186128.1 ABC transporter ATP-binding protein [Corynebacterium sp. zg-331]MPV52618.1 dipeptide ABC transporter ATP-binding protein [Corynebacterium sp. zg331]